MARIDEARQADPELIEKLSQKMEKDFNGHDWYGTTLESEKTQIIDVASGKPLIVRVFEYKMNPSIKKFPKNKQEIFNVHAREIKDRLWMDGIKPYEQASPKVFIDTKKRMYRIVVVAEPRLNMNVIETPTSLNKVLSTARKH